MFDRRCVRLTKVIVVRSWRWIRSTCLGLGYRTGPNEVENPNEPAITLFWHLEHTPWRTSKRNKDTNERYEQRFVRLIEGNVQEYTSPSEFAP
jgi:hypothetical protein